MPLSRSFPKRWGFPYAAAVSSGTAPIHLALRILGVEQGDEVIASTLTFIGGVTPIIFKGAMPVFIDSDSSSWTMDPDLLAEELESSKKRGKLRKSVIPTDLYGQCGSRCIFNPSFDPQIMKIPSIRRLIPVGWWVVK